MSPIDLFEAMRTTGSIRSFSPEEVSDEVLEGAFEAARFGPSGGNRQPVRWVVVRDPGLKRALADLYAPLQARDLEALRTGELRLGSDVEGMIAVATEFAAGLAEVPAMLVACAVVADLHNHMIGADGPNMIAGSCVYPIVQNLCLALRAQGVGSTITTLLCEREREVAELLAVPDGLRCACHLAVGYPRHRFPTRLTRLPVSELVVHDRFPVA
ncbi:MAG: nitroreductase family protein [Solirubrobacterales bacterium]